jgi:hypothetical protein
MPGHGSKLGRKKEEAIAALLNYRTVEEAARTINVNPKTLQRWMHNPEFEGAYRQARQQAYSQVATRIQQSMAPALATICKIMVDPNVPPTARLHAANYILNQGTKIMEVDDLGARVTELERVAKGLESERVQ